MQNLVSYNISTDPNDKDSIYLPDLIGAQLGIEEARNNLRQFLEYQEAKVSKVTESIPSMVNLINAYFGDRQ